MTNKTTIDIETFVAGVHDYISRALKPVVERLKALEEGPAATLADAYRGSWLPGKYARGCLVTHGGSLWLSVEDAEGKPGGSPSWRLVVKAGKDGRDA